MLNLVRLSADADFHLHIREHRENAAFLNSTLWNLGKNKKADTANSRLRASFFPNCRYPDNLLRSYREGNEVVFFFLWVNRYAEPIGHKTNRVQVKVVRREMHKRLVTGSGTFRFFYTERREKYRWSAQIGTISPPLRSVTFAAPSKIR